MSVRAGQLIHDAQGFVIDRIQTGGVGNLNIPLERINELGNYQTVAVTRDIPDLSFDVASLDVSTEMEALALRLDPTTIAPGQAFDFARAIPIDMLSPFKAGAGLFNIVSGIALPYLTLENVTYKYGLKANAEQTFTFRGDSVYYIPGSPYYQEYDKVSGPTYNFAHTAMVYVETGVNNYALGVCWFDPSTRVYRRLSHGADFTDSSAGITLTTAAQALIPTGGRVCVTYGSTVADTMPQSVHQGVSIKPAAVKGRDIDVYIGFGATPVMQRWTSVQSAEASRKVTLDADGEFGNHHYVTQDYDVAQVGGNLVVRPRDVNDLFTKIQEITNTSSSEISGPLSSQSVALEYRIFDPNATTTTCLKTIYCPDARFTPPAIQGRVGQKSEPTFPWESDSGTLLVYKGLRP